MRIGFDGKRTTQNFTGLGNYSRYVLRILGQYHPENHYSVFALRPHPRTEELNIPSISFHYPQKQLLKSYWRTYGIVNELKHEGIDLYHGLSNEIPFGLKQAGISSVVTIHDLIFLRYPHYYPFIDRKIYEFKFRHAAGHADKIIAISEQTKKDIINYFNIEKDRIEVIYQNCDPIFQQVLSDQEKLRIRSLYNLPEKYLLNVGTIETRKNLLLAVKALKELDSNIHLVVVGKETPYIEKINNFINSNGLTKRVRFLKNIDFKDLPGIYQQADIFIYPSEFEGFGIPIIEALHSGIPVIAAKGSCLEEAGGDGSIYVDPADHLSLADQIRLVLEDENKRQAMISAGREHLKKISDEKIANQLVKLYQNILINA